MPGMLRASFGCYNTTDDIDLLVEMLVRIAHGDYRGDYRVEEGSGVYLPVGYDETLRDYFILDDE
jgi:hypothetical protein